MIIERPYTDTYLNEYSEEHLAFEIDMFFSLAGWLSKHVQIIASNAEDARRINNAILLACGLHLRNLIDFLYIDNPQKTDVVASDFCVAGSWEAVRPPLSNTLEAARTRANKELAHLTTSRISGVSAPKKWDFAPLSLEIAPVLKQFASQARSTVLAPSVARSLL